MSHGEALSRRLGPVSDAQFQAGLDHFGLGRFLRATPVPFGLFGQNVFVTTTAGEFVLRGAAHYDWQLPSERFVARLLHERTAVPVPWPYLVNTDESIFGWPYGYAIMPRMPGVLPADPAVTAAMTGAERAGIARALGANLRAVHAVTWPRAGRFDLASGTVRAFEGGFAAWIVGELRRWLDLCVSYGTGATEADREWAERLIDEAAGALREPRPATLVLHDYREANVALERHAGRWRISGVFDLMEAIFADPELDLVRQLSGYLERPDTALAKAFLAGYGPLEAGAGARLRLYLAYDRMIVWEFFHRPDNLASWSCPERTPREWIAPYLRGLASASG